MELVLAMVKMLVILKGPDVLPNRKTPDRIFNKGRASSPVKRKGLTMVKRHRQLREMDASAGDR